MLYPIENQYRTLKNLDGFWNFSADNENVSEKEGWNLRLGGKIQQLGVPASWNEQINELYNFHGKGWYEKSTFIPKEWADKSVFLRFGSVAGKATVFVNGALAFSHIGTALPFEADISKLLNYGMQNRITVIADSSLDPWSLPPTSLQNNEGRAGFSSSYPAVPYDFFPYGGIQRSVWLYTASKNRIEDIIITTDISENFATVSYKIIFTENFSGKITVKTDSKIQEIEITNQNIAEGVFEIENPRLWEIGKGELYELTVSTDFDEYTQNYGIRTIKIESDKFLLNGKPVFFKGFGKHEDFFIIGKGFNHALWTKDFYLLDWIGANSFRTSHYPYDENIMALADKNGIMIIDETPFVSFGGRIYTDQMLNKANKVIEELYWRDKNHPSVVMWSLANEPHETDTPEGIEFFGSMFDTIRALDKTRPVTYVASLEAEQSPTIKFCDMICYNKYAGWYFKTGMGADSDDIFIESLEKYYNTYKKPILLAEFGADAIAGMHSDPPVMFTEEYQRDTVLRQYGIIKKMPFVIGAHVWAFANFKTAQTISRVVDNHKGVFTRDRQPKLLAHALRELWKNEDK